MPLHFFILGSESEDGSGRPRFLVFDEAASEGSAEGSESVATPSTGVAFSPLVISESAMSPKSVGPVLSMACSGLCS